MKKILSLLIIFSLFAFYLPRVANASSLTSYSDAMSRAKITTLSDHTIQFTTPTGVAASATIILTFESNFALGTVDYTDIDLTDDTVDVVLAAAPSGTTWGVVKSDQVITFTNGSAAVVAGSVIAIEIGTNATSGDQQITNPTTAGSFQIAVTGSFGDTGEVDLAIMDDDQVTITATVDTYTLFDLDIAAAHGDSDAPYAISLGELVFTSITTATNNIYLDLDTNAEGGASLSVKDSNDGLKSTAATPDYTITSASETLQINQNIDDGYGLQNGTWSATSGTWTESNTYNVSGNAVGAVSTTWAEVANTTTEPIVGGSGEIILKAVAAKATPAADDYTDTLTFRVVTTY